MARPGFLGENARKERAEGVKSVTSLGRPMRPAVMLRFP